MARKPVTIPDAKLESTIITRLAKVIAETKYEDLPEEVVYETKRLLLDSCGTGMSGMSCDKGKFALNIARRLFPGDEATVLGIGERLSAVGAATVSGECMNAMDNTVIVPPGHIAEYIIPSVLAYAQKNHNSGEDVILATALGYELVHRIGGACSYHRDIKDGKLDPPKVSGTASSLFGAVAALCSLDGLDHVKTADALGIAAWSSPINNLQIWGQHVRSAVKYGNAAVFAETAFTCFEQAKIGYEGDWWAFEDDGYGWGAMVTSSRWVPDNIETDYGKKWLYPAKQSYKLYPACRLMAAPCDLTKETFIKNSLNAADVESILIQGEGMGLTGAQWCNPNPRAQWESECSMQHNIAMAALGYEPGPAWLDPRTLQDPRVYELRNKITYEAHPDYIACLQKDPASRPTHLEIKMKDGKVYTADSLYPKGNNTPIESKMNEDELFDKYTVNTQRLLPIAKIDKSINALMSLETYKDINDVFELLGI